VRKGGAAQDAERFSYNLRLAELVIVRARHPGKDLIFISTVSPLAVEVYMRQLCCGYSFFSESWSSIAFLHHQMTRLAYRTLQVLPYSERSSTTTAPDG
jgi:hypothetical protein